MSERAKRVWVPRTVTCAPRTRSRSSSEHGPVLDAVCTEIFQLNPRLSEATKTLVTRSTRSVVLALSSDHRLTAASFGQVAAMIAALLPRTTDDEALGFVSYAIAANDEHGAAATKLASIVAARGAKAVEGVAALAAQTETRTAKRLFSELFAAAGIKETVIRVATANPETLAPHALDTLFSDSSSAHSVAVIAVSGYLDPSSKWTRVAVERVLAPERVVKTKAFWHPDVIALVKRASSAQVRASNMVRLIATRDARLTARSGLLPWAAEETGRIRFLEILLDSGVRLSYANEDEEEDPYVYESTRSAISRACASGNVAALRRMFRSDRACFVRHFDSARLACTLLASAHAEFVALAEETRFCISGTFVDGHTTLAMAAASTGNAAALVYLLGRGSDTKTVTLDTRESIMHLIAKLDAPSIDMVTACVESRATKESVKWGLFRALYKKDSAGAVPIEVCSSAQHDLSLSAFMRLCVAIDEAPTRRVLLLFGFLPARRSDAEHIFGVARSLGYTTSEICGARTKDDDTDTLGLAASRPDDTLFRSLVSLLSSEGAANAALFRADAMVRLARRSPEALASIYRDVVVPEAHEAIRAIERASILAAATRDFVAEGPACLFGNEVIEDARRVALRLQARRAVHESYLNMSAARDLFTEFARAVARSVESRIYGGAIEARIDGIEVFEFLIGIGAHEPLGYTEDTRDSRYGYFASIFVPCARHILASLRGTGLVVRYVLEICEAVNSTGISYARNLEHLRIDRAAKRLQPEVLAAIFDGGSDDDDDDEGRVHRSVDYHSIADIRFVGEEATGPGQTREAINVLWTQITADRGAFALTPGGLVPRPFACERLMGLAGFIVGTAMRAKIPLGLPHLCPTIASAVVAPIVDHTIGESVVAEMFGADGIVLAAKSPSFALSTEDFLSYCSPSDDIECSALGPTVTHATFGAMCNIVADSVLGSPAMHAMRGGFHSALCAQCKWGARQIASMLASSIFEPRDASLLFFGTTAVSVDRIRAKTQLVSSTTGDTYESHDTESLAIFWDLFGSELTEEQRLTLFTFWTSNASFPLCDSPDEWYLISPMSVHNAPLFTASTCANHLRVPRYTDKATMLAKLIASLDACGYMGLL